MLWDTAGQEEFDAITKAYYRGICREEYVSNLDSNSSLLQSPDSALMLELLTFVVARQLL